MCGIFGVITDEKSALPLKKFHRLTDKLFILSETRGKEASGLTLLPSKDSESLLVFKSASSASQLIVDKEYKHIFSNGVFGLEQKMAGVAFGHTRLVTNGSQLDANNNQPVICEDSVAVHNGIIVNVDELWDRHPELVRKSEVDTEILLALTRKYYIQTSSPTAAVKKVFSEIKGTASIALTFADLNVVVLATNNGSLYLARRNPGEPIYFASEKFTLDKLVKSHIGIDFRGYEIRQLAPNQGLLVNLDDFSENSFNFSDNGREVMVPRRLEARNIKSVVLGNKQQTHSVVEIQKVHVPHRFITEVNRVQNAVRKIKRCSCCVLPETVPFIDFNESGVCNFCLNYKRIELKGREALEKELAPYRRPGSERDCVAALSGGRDSCYGLHYMVKELGMKPVAYTYDWGMVTDLARRNIARMCSALGVEHILISANIPWKRENIRKNVLAWLKKPHLGMIPLFMAGDKQFVWYANRVKRQTGIELDIFTFNLLEKTQFKEEYTGIQFWKPGEDSDKLGEELGLVRGVKLCSFYGKEFITNWAYLNRSLFDTFYGFVAYYILPQTFVPMFHYIEWREDKVVDLLLKEYDWELATDTVSTWRIGDGTASFYNYIYYIVGGFSENDTLRSNQIREGHVSRDEALMLIERDNQPRWDSFKWYCDIIGVDFENTVDRINEIPKTHAFLEAR